MTGVLDVLLDQPLLPAGGWIAELGLEQEVADHGREARVDLALLAAADEGEGGRTGRKIAPTVSPANGWRTRLDGSGRRAVQSVGYNLSESGE